MAPKKSKEYVNRSIRMPLSVWDLVKRISGRTYRSLNSQFIKIVEDCALLLEAMCGYDQKDSTSINKKKESYSKNLRHNINGLKIGIPKEYRVENMPKEIDNLWNKGIDILKKSGAKIVDITLPHTKYAYQHIIL